MKNLFKTLCMMIGMVVSISVNAQSPEGWEDEVVDMLIWGHNDISIKPAEDTIHITGLICDEFNNGEYEGYLPIVLEYPVIQEFFDRVSHETIGYSKYLRVNDACQISALTAGPRTKDYSGIIVYDAYARPAQMVPFTDTILVEEGKQHTLKPWHWVPYEETFIGTGRWWINGETLIQDGMIQDGMMSVKIFGPDQGDTVVYTVRVVDRRNSIIIVNTFIVIGIPKSDFGVEDNEISNISIYPNPSNDGVVTLRGEGIAEIFNILGQKVKEVEIMEETKVSLPSGLYFVRAGSATQKVVVR